MNGIKCGKCKLYHPTVHEVRSCFAGVGAQAKTEEKLMKEVREAKPTSLVEYEADELFI